MSTDPALIYGTLGTQASTAGIESQAGATMAMLELNWASFEPRPGVVSASYLATMRSCLRAYQTAGQRVTLGLGLHYPPSWVFSRPGSRYVDQNGDVSTEADFVFSQAVRCAAAQYLALVAAALPLSDFWAIRLTSGGDGEMLYPPGGSYWAFGPAALTGAGLAAGMSAAWPTSPAGSSRPCPASASPATTRPSRQGRAPGPVSWLRTSSRTSRTTRPRPSAPSGTATTACSATGPT
jgi:hypothetical protein